MLLTEIAGAVRASRHQDFTSAVCNQSRELLGRVGCKQEAELVLTGHALQTRPGLGRFLDAKDDTHLVRGAVATDGNLSGVDRSAVQRRLGNASAAAVWIADGNFVSRR